MTTQTTAITADPNLTGTLTCALFAPGGNVAIYTGTVTKLTNAKGQYLCTFSSLVAAGVYVLILFQNGNGAASATRAFTGVDGEFGNPTAGGGTATIENQTLMLQKLAVIQGAGFTGPHSVTITVTGNAVNLDGARVALSRNGLSQTQTTVAGVTVFTVDPGTYVWQAVCAGFGGLTGSVVVAANVALPIALPQLVVTPSAIPDLTTGFLIALDAVGQPEGGAKFYSQLVRGPSGSGYGYDQEVREVTSAAVTGLTQFPGLVKGAVYYLWRGEKKDKTERTVPLGAASTWPVENLAGKEAV
jgi:hypothetical protein